MTFNALENMPEVGAGVDQRPPVKYVLAPLEERNNSIEETLVVR